MDGFALPILPSTEQIFPETITTDGIFCNTFIDNFRIFWTSNESPHSQLYCDDSTISSDHKFVDLSSNSQSISHPITEIVNVTSSNVVNQQKTSNPVDSLLTSENIDVSTFPIIENASVTSLFEEVQTKTSSSLPIPAFPGAEGFGALSIGGRGGQIIEVTNLNDSGSGSLRAALEAEGARIVVFRVSGTIQLKDTIRIQNPYLTVAGQTAPGGGILLRGTDSTLVRIEDGAHDIIIRYLRLRNGSGEIKVDGNDNISIKGGYNIILDHISMSWSTDENASIHRKLEDPSIYNITIQNSIFAEGLKGHSHGLLIGGELELRHPSEHIDSWKEVKRISIHNNLFAHNSHRNPRVTSSNSQIINNVMYNWDGRIGETTRGAIVDYINNYAKPGPVSNIDHLFLHENFDPLQPNVSYPDPSIYTEGNVVKSVQTDPNDDNWNLWKLNFTYEPVPQSYRRFTPLQKPPIPVSIESAYDAYKSVLTDVGANARLDCSGDWISNSDSVDVRILADVRHGTGSDKPISDPDQVGGYPKLSSGRLCGDNDHDGMSNVWEYLHGLNPKDPTDGFADADGDGYTNVEEYLNGQS